MVFMACGHRLVMLRIASPFGRSWTDEFSRVFTIFLRRVEGDRQKFTHFPAIYFYFYFYFYFSLYFRREEKRSFFFTSEDLFTSPITSFEENFGRPIRRRHSGASRSAALDRSERSTSMLFSGGIVRKALRRIGLQGAFHTCQTKNTVYQERLSRW